MYFSRVQIRPDISRDTQLAKVLVDNAYNAHRLLWDLFPNRNQRNFIYREEIAGEQIPLKPEARGKPIYYMVSSSQPLTDNPIFLVETKDYQPKLQQGDLLRFELRANPVVTRKVDRENPEQFRKERSLRPVKDKNKLTKKRVRHDVAMDAQKEFLKALCEEFNLQSMLSANPQKKEFKEAIVTMGNAALDHRLTQVLKESYSYCERLEHRMQMREKLEWATKAAVDKALQNWMVKQGKQHGFVLSQNRLNHAKLQTSAYQWHTVKADKEKKSGFSSVDFVGELEITDVEVFQNALFNGIGRAKAFGCGLMLVRRI